MRTNSIYRVVVLLIVATLILAGCKVPGPTLEASPRPIIREQTLPRRPYPSLMKQLLRLKNQPPPFPHQPQSRLWITVSPRSVGRSGQ